ncbi:MAG: transposase [Acidobacteria bacterium]|nr:transposase [Acidobacteriota bacterium]
MFAVECNQSRFIPKTGKAAGIDLGIECFAAVRKSLAVREHRCINCGFVAHRDHNAAINIQKRGQKRGHVLRGWATKPV